MTSFCAPAVATASVLIGEISAESVYRTTANLLRRNTRYVKQMHVELQAKRHFPFPSSSMSTLPTNELGHLLIGKSSPIMLKQYRIRGSITCGTFSQIFQAVDLHDGRVVAIKVMRIGYSELGQREYELLRLMQRKTLRGKQYCEFDDLCGTVNVFDTIQSSFTNATVYTL